MANIENLKPVQSKSEARELGRKGGIASGEARRKKATMLSVLENMLDEVPKCKENEKGLTNKELVTLGLINGAAKEFSKNYELIQQLMEKKEQKDEENNIIITLPAKDIAKSFVDINRAIDDRDYREFYLEGGRGSTKSSFISEKIIELLENNPRMCAVVLRKVKDTLKDSVFAQLEWAIDTLSETYPGLKDRWKLTKSPLEMTNTNTGQKIYFRGADDYGKIKSLKTPKDMYVGITWYEEFDQFAGMMEVRKINQSLIRGGDDFIQFYSYNTPASSQHFVNREKRIPKPTRTVNLSDYRSVPRKWLGEAFIDEAEFFKSINEDLYNNEYLGLETGDGSTVFTNLEIREITDEEISHFDNIYHGIDWGYFPDAWAYNDMHYDSSQRTLYIYFELEELKKGNLELQDIMLKNGISKEELITADSNEPKSIGDFRMWGWCMRGAEKGAGSRDAGYKWLQTRAKIVIDPIRCPRTMEEFTSYEYDRDKEGNIITGYPEGQADHHIAASRYATERIWKHRGQ